MTPEELVAKLPPGFRLGVSTSSYQIEGGADERGKAGWDVFAAEPGHILDGSDAITAADHYHRMPEDVALLRELGVDSYRFSLSWPRVQPGGRGPASARGLAFYDRLLDELLAAGIRPMATLFHWDTPDELDREGGWAHRDTAYRFADYAAIAAEAFGDRVADWVTINEPATLVLEGYMLDIHSPGRGVWLSGVRAAHHLLLGHGLAVRALRAAKVSGRIGISNAHSPVFAASSRWADRFAATNFDLLNNRVFADPVLLGRRPRGLLGAALRLAALPHPEDARIIAEPIDFYGIQYYFPSRVAAGPPKLKHGTHDGHSTSMLTLPLRLEPWSEYPETGFGWPVAPEMVTTLLRQFADRYGDRLPPVLFTEGGASFVDRPDARGDVEDTYRSDYLAGHIAAAAEPVPGVDVEGYYVWSLLDNFEWAAGYTQHFGLVAVDPATQERRRKGSFEWYREVLSAKNG